MGIGPCHNPTCYCIGADSHTNMLTSKQANKQAINQASKQASKQWILDKRVKVVKITYLISIL
jgi:hypothetical protein